MTLGRHTNDRMFSFYAKTPSGVVVEYGWGGREITDPDHVTNYFTEASVWGHRHPEQPA